MPQSHCCRTCRDRWPYEPEFWCTACIDDEAVDREQNMLSWRKADLRQRAIRRWKDRFASLQNTPEIAP